MAFGWRKNYGFAFLPTRNKNDLSHFIIRYHFPRDVNYRVSAATILIEKLGKQKEGKHSVFVAANQTTDRDSHCLLLMSEPLDPEYRLLHKICIVV